MFVQFWMLEKSFFNVDFVSKTNNQRLLQILYYVTGKGLRNVVEREGMSHHFFAWKSSSRERESHYVFRPHPFRGKKAATALSLNRPHPDSSQSLSHLFSKNHCCFTTFSKFLGGDAINLYPLPVFMTRVWRVSISVAHVTQNIAFISSVKRVKYHGVHCSYCYAFMLAENPYNSKKTFFTSQSFNICLQFPEKKCYNCWKIVIINSKVFFILRFWFLRENTDSLLEINLWRT